MIQIKVEDLDANENMLNTPDATYDLRKGMAGAMEHSPSDLLTKITTVSPGDKGKICGRNPFNYFSVVTRSLSNMCR